MESWIWIWLGLVPLWSGLWLSRLLGGWAGGGWWGPRMYHPAYTWNRYRTYEYYGNNFYRNRNIYANHYTTNIYRNRGGIVTRNVSGGSYYRPVSTRPVATGGRPGGSFNGSSRPITQGSRPGGYTGRPNGFTTRPG